MAEDISKLNIYQRLAKIRKIADVVKKGKQGYGYTYADITEILAKVKGGMETYHVSLIPQFVHGSSVVERVEIRKTKVDKNKGAFDKVENECLIHAEMVYRWVNDDDPSEMVDVPWILVAQMEDAAQALGSGLTYDIRQFLTSYFQIAQDNDVDKYRSEQKKAENAEDLAIAGGITADILRDVKMYLADHESKREEVVKFFKRYERSGDPSKITDPAIALKLQEDFRAKYMKGAE